MYALVYMFVFWPLPSLFQVPTRVPGKEKDWPDTTVPNSNRDSIFHHKTHTRITEAVCYN